MELKAKTEMILCLLTLIASIFVVVPIAQSSPDTYGPRLDELYGRFIESPAAQRFALETGEVDVWFDIREPELVRELDEAGFQMSIVPETFLYYHIDFNVRDQLNPGAETPGATPWRTESGDYYSYSGTPYTNYVPLDDQAFRHAVAHLIPKSEIEAVVYGGITGAAIDSLVPAAQKAWYKEGVDGHPWSRAEAVSILQAAGYVWQAGAPNPVAGAGVDYWGETGNWIDPATGEPMNHITFAGVTQAIAPRSWGRDDMCAREFNAIGLPIEHVEVAFSYLTDTMMDYYQFDMYALGWQIGRFPDHLYSFFHSSNNFVPEGYNIPGVENATLDALLEIIEHSTSRAEVKQAAYDAQDLLAELCVSLPTVTRPAIAASVTTDVTGAPDTLKGVVNSPGFGHDTEFTFNSLRWASMETPGNPLGIGGSAAFIVGSAPTNYHPGYASTVDEWNVVGRLFDGLINVDPYTHDDIPWMATSWNISDWTAPGDIPGMNMTFWLRDDIYWHDGVHYDANSAKWSLEFTRDQEIGRYFNVWQYLVDIEVHDTYTFSTYYNVTSLWIFYDVAGTAALFPQHLYADTTPTFRPEALAHPTIPGLTKLIGTGPFVFRPDSNLELGGFAHLTAYRPAASPVTTHWFMSVEGLDALYSEMFHWIGDIYRDDVIDIWDLFDLRDAWGSKEEDANYNSDADIWGLGVEYHENDGKVNIFDGFIFAKNWGKQKDYP